MKNTQGNKSEKRVKRVDNKQRYRSEFDIDQEWDLQNDKSDWDQVHQYERDVDHRLFN